MTTINKIIQSNFLKNINTVDDDKMKEGWLQQHKNQITNARTRNEAVIRISPEEMRKDIMDNKLKTREDVLWN
jgi:hypothetical protein